MNDYDDLMSAWRDKRTGLCHLSLRGTVWPGNYEQISMDAYRGWQKTKTVSHGGVLPNLVKNPKTK